MQESAGAGFARALDSRLAREDFIASLEAGPSDDGRPQWSRPHHVFGCDRPVLSFPAEMDQVTDATVLITAEEHRGNGALISSDGPWS